MTCPCGLTRLEFKLRDRRGLLRGSRWNIEIAAVAFALFPASRDIPSLWHLSANQSDGQLTRREQRRGPPSRFVLVGLVVKEVEWHLGAWRHSALLKWCSAVCLVVQSRGGNVWLWEFMWSSCWQPYFLPESNKISALFYSVLSFSNNKDLLVPGVSCSIIFYCSLVYYFLFLLLFSIPF